MESVALPKVTPYLLRYADSMCSRRLAEEIEGGTRSDDPVNRARLREAFLDAVRNIHAEMRAPVLRDFDGIGPDLEPEEQAVLAQAARSYVQLFGDRRALLHDHGLDEPTESRRRSLRIGGWVDLTVVGEDGTKELRQFDLWCGRVPLAATDLEAVRLALLRLARWIDDDPIRVVWCDLVRLDRRECVVGPEELDALKDWFEGRVAVARDAVAHPKAVNSSDCSQCNFVAGCPEHGSWHGRARSVRHDDIRPSILRLNPSSVASWNRCAREWRNALLVVSPSDPPGPTHHGNRVHALLKLVHEEGSCEDDALIADVLARHGAEDDERIRADLGRHTALCPRGATALGHELTRARFQFRPGPPFMTSARMDALWRYDDVLDAHDYKTSWPWDHQLRDDTQARLQAWVLAPLAEELGLRVRVSFENLSSATTVQPTPFEPDADDLREIEEELRTTVAAMRAESTFAGVSDPDVCRYCRYRSICPDSAAPSLPVWPGIEPDESDESDESIGA